MGDRLGIPGDVRIKNDALGFLKELARQDARRWGKDSAMEIKNFFQHLSITLQRGNTALLLGRDPKPPTQRANC